MEEAGLTTSSKSGQGYTWSGYCEKARKGVKYGYNTIHDSPGSGEISQAIGDHCLQNGRA